MLNKYLFVCHVGCGPFPQKNRVFRMHVKAMVLPWQRILKAWIFSPLGLLSTSLAWLYEYTSDWDVFFLLFWHIKVIW